MKATFFTTIATMALSAFAAPIISEAKDIVVHQVGGVQDGVKNVANVDVTAEVEVGKIDADITAAAGKRSVSLSTVGDLISILTNLLDDLKGQSTTFQTLASQVDNGKLTVEQCADAAVPLIQDTRSLISEVVTALTGTVASALDATESEVATLVKLVVNIVSVVLTNVRTIVNVTGLRPQLTSLLHSVFSILNSLIILVIGLVSAILPALVAALTPLLATVTGVLVPVLSPIVGLLASLRLPTTIFA
ncbi:hypothetical protein B0J13DRAFT_676318 [Dactylonectria estremocensis]|uniref:Uncharacterized protein n=1 Tax=Dactylonectria estremocensis TaxID=1079267 RepID=A0A9P9J440_9HYPO|nr:hypothetical protein B0J13DRAFT_676318 [Dactylonectria estremocensis]